MSSTIQFLSSSEWTRYPLTSDERMLLLWHVGKFVEVSVREDGACSNVYTETNIIDGKGALIRTNNWR